VLAVIDSPEVADRLSDAGLVVAARGRGQPGQQHGGDE
jgi:hypothetical protein